MIKFNTYYFNGCNTISPKNIKYNFKKDNDKTNNQIIKLLFNFEIIDEKINKLKETLNEQINKNNIEFKKTINGIINKKIEETNKLKENLIDSINIIDKKIKENNNIPCIYPSHESGYLTNERQIEFFDVNITKIHFNYHFMSDKNIEMCCNNKRYVLDNYSDLIKFINLFKNINLISIDIIKSKSIKNTNIITLIEIKQFDIIKEICRINKNVKLEINIHAINYQFNNLQYLFSDIKHENITNINIKYTDLLINVNKNFNENINKKIMLIPGKII